ncbi:copper resistance CopC family protein [Mycolicibacterium sediminis]|uniref:Putative copper resistance protein, CopC family n=1 Tax=Mycolicibacterium sediminis TaxID=1286180 RepID=A0A7I7QYQ4_9MYCO|nr:copper resistance CopC family protein [Mycolicibacterium sediminis]BBY31523.1 putative copper resistance protein, CopC family [Mycolicibacterium sediminis]
MFDMTDVKATVRVVVTSLAALAFWMAGAGIATAHTALSGSDPAEGASLAASPTAITLSFSEDINPTFVNVVLSSADGRSWISGDPRVDGPRVVTEVRPDLPTSGVYTVGYRVVSADGHPVSGSYTFTISGVPGEAPPASVSASPTPSITAAPSAEAPADPGTELKTIALAVAGATFVGVVAFWVLSKRRRHTRASRTAGPSQPGG